MSMEVLAQTQEQTEGYGSAPTLSPDGQHIACIQNGKIRVLQAATLAEIAIWSLDQHMETNKARIEWAPVHAGHRQSVRVLAYDSNVAEAFDIADNAWRANLKCSQLNMAAFVKVTFCEADDRILTIPAFHLPYSVWCLRTGNMICAIPNPKFATAGVAKNTLDPQKRNNLDLTAIVRRENTADIVSVHRADTYAELYRLKYTSGEVQDAKWSPSGHWLAVWESPRTGFKVSIYVAFSGAPYRSYTGDYFDHDIRDLGVKTVEWSPDNQWLALGGYSHSVTLLNARTFSAASYVYAYPTIKNQSTKVFRQVSLGLGSAISSQYVTEEARPIQLPVDDSVLASGTPKMGASIITFSCDGEFLAMKEDSQANVAWVYNLTTSQCNAVLIQAAPIKALQFHPTEAGLLMISCDESGSRVYTYDAMALVPTVQDLKIGAHSQSKPDLSVWLPSTKDGVTRMLLGRRGFFTVLASGDVGDEAETGSFVSFDGAVDVTPN